MQSMHVFMYYIDVTLVLAHRLAVWGLSAMIKCEEVPTFATGRVPREFNYKQRRMNPCTIQVVCFMAGIVYVAIISPIDGLLSKR